MNQSDDTGITYETLAERLSHITGQEVKPSELEQFESPIGTLDDPVLVVDGSCTFTGYTRYWGDNDRHFGATFDLDQGHYSKLSAQRIDYSDTKTHTEVVHAALLALINLHENPTAGVSAGYGSERLDYQM